MSTERVNNIAGADQCGAAAVTKAMLLVALRCSTVRFIEGAVARRKREIVGREERPTGMTLRASCSSEGKSVLAFCWSDWKSILLE